MSYGRTPQSPTQAALTPEPRYNTMSPPKSDALWNAGTFIKPMFPGFGDSFRSLGAGTRLEPHNYASAALEGLAFAPLGRSAKMAEPMLDNVIGRWASSPQSGISRTLMQIPKAAQARYESMPLSKLNKAANAASNKAAYYHDMAGDFGLWSNHDRYVQAARAARDRADQLSILNNLRAPKAFLGVPRSGSMEEASRTLQNIRATAATNKNAMADTAEAAKQIAIGQIQSGIHNLRLHNLQKLINYGRDNRGDQNGM